MNTAKTDVVAYVAIAVIIVSLASIGLEMTGRATYNDTAYVNVTISTSAELNFTIDVINFGTGTVTGGTIGAKLDSLGNTTNSSGFTTVTQGFVLNNTGNVDFSNLSIKADADADGFIGGSSPTFKYMVSNIESNSCDTNEATSWTDFATAAGEICSTGFDADDTQDSIEIDVELFIPSDATGTKGAVVTAVGEYS